MKKGVHNYKRKSYCITTEGAIMQSNLHTKSLFVFFQNEQVIPLGLFTKDFDMDGYITQNIQNYYFEKQKCWEVYTNEEGNLEFKK